MKAILKMEQTTSDYQDMLKALDDSSIVSILDKDGKIVYANHAFCKISGYNPDELEGKTPRELFQSDYPDSFYDEIWHKLKRGITWHGDIKNKNKKGHEFWNSATIVPFMDEDEKPRKFIAIRRDITQRVIAEEKLKDALTKIEEQKEKIEANFKELQEMDKLKEQFASMVTHELKTPLVPIRGYCKMLKEPDVFGELTTEQLEAVDEINENAARLERLIGDVLDAQRLDMNRMTFNKADFDPIEIISKVKNDLQFMANNKNIQITQNTPSQSIKFHGDKNRIRQVIENLVRNAVDFVPKDTGKIEIGLEKKDGTLEFSVKDNGIGIPEDKQKNLFKKFYQVDTTHARQHGGSGLGLAIAKGVVTGHGGKIWVDSKVGKGSTFYFGFTEGFQ